MSGLKLKLNTGTKSTGLPFTTPTQTPTSTTAKPRIKLTSNSVPPTPTASQTPPKLKKTKAGRAPKPSAKIIESRKRRDESDDDDAGSTIDVQPPSSKRVKLSITKSKATGSATAPKTPATPAVVLKQKGKPPKRPWGEGYDSDASDREEDPTIEEQFIIRMPPGPDCDYVRQLITEKKIGTTRDFHMRFYDGEGRTAAVFVRNNIYAATVVDLPCIIEGMKSWDKRGQWKSADICQMLLVHTQVKTEEEAKKAPLPREIDTTTHQYPHGLTPPMHLVRKRRFRKRLHKTQIEAVEKELDRLLAADAEAEQTSYVIFDPDAEGRSEMGYTPGAMETEEEYSGEEDAEGEEDDASYFGNSHHAPEQEESGMDMDALFEAEIEAAILGHSEEVESATPMSNALGTPQANGQVPGAVEEDSGDDSFEDDDMDEREEQADEIDEEEKERLAQLQATREEITHLKDKLDDAHRNLSHQTNPILKNRLTENIRKLKQELQLKMSSIGEDEENE